MKLPHNDILVFDIETTSTDIETAELRFFGAYSYKTNERYYIEDNGQLVQELFDNHKVLVGFNIKRFDLPILQRYGIYVRDNIIVDLWEVLSEPRLDPKTRIRSGGKGRGEFMGLDLNSWSLANIVKALELGEYKTENFDYTILQKSTFTQADRDYIIQYLSQDITVTKRLFEAVNNFFVPLTEHLSEKNINRMTYITASIASLAYKILCHEAGVEETYGEGEKNEQYEGGYVRYPTKEEYIGPVLCLDFQSMYPGNFRAFNLFSPAPEDYPFVFTGNDFFKIKGRYKADQLGKFESVVAKLFNLRKEYKKNKDRRQYLIKIIINALYGISPKPTFEQIYNRYGAEDCTAIGRQMIQYAADEFNKDGYEVLYGDTDSLYIALKEHSKEDALKKMKKLNEFFRSKTPFPHDDFGMGLDAEIQAIFFFPDGEGSFKKKNYIYIKEDGKLEIMGLPIIKSNASKIATLILDKYLKEQMISKKSIKFAKGYLQQLIYHELEGNLQLATQTYKVKTKDEYAGESGLYAQIANKFGSGIVDLIPNNKFGIGIGKKYCTLEEFKTNRLTVADIDLSVTWNNLEPFIKNEQKGLGDFGA